MTDDYQRRYQAHRQRKAAMIAALPFDQPAERKAVKERRSIRCFCEEPPAEETLQLILRRLQQAPQSCNRQALKVKVVTGKDIASWLPGGEGWLGYAPTVVLIFMDMAAYKSPVEVAFMPWLDAGVALATLVYSAAAVGLGSCIVNPHVRAADEAAFRDRYNKEGYLFCGAVALGYAAIEAEMPEKKPIKELMVDAR